MTTQFDSNTFEHDYIISVLMHMVTDLKTDKPVEQIIDKYAVSLTAFMTGVIVQAVVEPHKEKSNVDGEGYWCVVCERLLFPDEEVSRVPRKTIWRRLYDGWQPERAVFTPTTPLDGAC